jgi:hypothetical protein
MRLRGAVSYILALSMIAGSYSFRIIQPAGQEYNLKAAFLYRFLDYVEWENNPHPESLNIAILGESDIIPPLQEISSQKNLQNRRINIRQVNNISDLASNQIIFVSRNYKYSVESIVSKLAGKPALIISEKEKDFAKGTHINFLISDNKLKFEVNLNATSRSGLKISSELLQHALMIKR